MAVPRYEISVHVETAYVPEQSLPEAGRFVFVNATLARWLGEDIQTLLSGAYLHTYFEEVPEDAHSSWNQAWSR